MTEAEYGRYKTKLMLAARKVLHDETMRLGRSEQQRGINLAYSFGSPTEQFGSTTPDPHTLRGQQSRPFVKLAWPSGDSHEIEAIIGHDSDWKPVVSVSRTGKVSETISINTTGDAEADAAPVREKVLEFFRAVTPS
jgi:hypothetical protein